MSTTGEQLASAESSSRKSLVERFVGVFTSPGEAFADIGRAPDFVAPLVVAIVATVAVTETMLARIGIERIVRASIEHSSRASSLSPDQLQQQVEQGAKFGAILAHVSGLLGAPIVLLIVAGLGLLVVNAILGGKLNFKTAFSVTSYANLVNVLGALVALAMILFGDPEHFNAQNPLPTNPGFFLPLETSKPLMSLASSFDIFTLWFMALVGIGFSEATGRKVKALSVFLCLFGIWLVWVLAKMGLSMLG